MTGWHMDTYSHIQGISYFPIYLEIKGKKVLVVGGGIVAQRKIESLLETGALIVVVSIKVTNQIRQFEKEGRIKIIGRQYEESFLENVFMVIAATDNAELNHRVSKDAREKGLLINAVDQPQDCNFIFPSVMKRGDLTLAISTSGKSPALARKIREQLEQEFGQEYEVLLKIMGNLRKEILSWKLPQDRNKGLFNQLIEGSLLEAARKRDWNRASEIINRILDMNYSSAQIKKMGEGH